MYGSEELPDSWAASSEGSKDSYEEDDEQKGCWAIRQTFEIVEESGSGVLGQLV